MEHHVKHEQAVDQAPRFGNNCTLQCLQRHACVKETVTTLVRVELDAMIEGLWLHLTLHAINLLHSWPRHASHPGMRWISSSSRIVHTDCSKVVPNTLVVFTSSFSVCASTHAPTCLRGDQHKMNTRKRCLQPRTRNTTSRCDLGAQCLSNSTFRTACELLFRFISNMHNGEKRYWRFVFVSVFVKLSAWFSLVSSRSNDICVIFFKNAFSGGAGRWCK